MIAKTDLSWNKITYCQKGSKVMLIKKHLKHTVFQNKEDVQFRVSNELVPLYFREEGELIR